MTYLGEKDYHHGSPERLGVLVVNLGTPDAPEPGPVRRYLKEFLWDPRIIELPRPLWWAILNLVILNIRPRRSARAYREVWTDEGSPLLVYTRRVAERLEQELATALPGPVRVAVGMTYGNPSIASALATLREAGCRRLLVLPLYPQYSATTTGSVFDRLASCLMRTRWLPELRFITTYHDEPLYIEALASRIEQHWQTHGRGERLLFSFHGIPRRYLLNGDPYHCQCHKTARQVAERLGLAQDQWHVAFQSRVGREEWLRPYTDETLEQWGADGLGDIDVVCPGFAADCLETLEEIAMENAERFAEHGGGTLRYIPALNDGADHIALLATLARRHVAGWPEASAQYDETAREADAQASRERALEMGAPR
ncbi:MAG: ferrochelatase [Gammaproteobacteria bacterium]|nr:MAG: ferrochelatase [Gammaproteobacteria bacterium]